MKAIYSSEVWCSKILLKKPSQKREIVWGHAAIFAWSDLILDHSHKLVSLQSPFACATRSGGNSDPNFKNFDLSTPSPRTPDAVFMPVRGSWRANRDVDVRR